MLKVRTEKGVKREPITLFSLKNDGEGVTVTCETDGREEWNVLKINKSGVTLYRAVGRESDFKLEDNGSIVFLGTD